MDESAFLIVVVIVLCSGMPGQTLFVKFDNSLGTFEIGFACCHLLKKQFLLLTPNAYRVRICLNSSELISFFSKFVSVFCLILEWPIPKPNNSEWYLARQFQIKIKNSLDIKRPRLVLISSLFVWSRDQTETAQNGSHGCFGMVGNKNRLLQPSEI